MQYANPTPAGFRPTKYNARRARSLADSLEPFRELDPIARDAIRWLRRMHLSATEEVLDRAAALLESLRAKYPDAGGAVR